MCGGQWLPCAWRDHRVGGGAVPHPRPLFPLQLVRPRPTAPARPEPPPAGLGLLARHLQPRRGAVAGSQPKFGGGRGPLAAPTGPRPPRARRPARAPRPTRMQIRGSRSQWQAGPGPPCCVPASGREMGAGHHAHRRAAPRGRGRRVPFRTSASGRGRHLPGGACGRRVATVRGGSPAGRGGWYGPRRSPAPAVGPQLPGTRRAGMHVALPRPRDARGARAARGPCRALWLAGGGPAVLRWDLSP